MRVRGVLEWNERRDTLLLEQAHNTGVFRRDSDTEVDEYSKLMTHS